MNSETHIKSSTNNSTRARAQRSSTPRRFFLYGKLQITAGFARRMELTAGDRGFAMKQRTKKAPSRPPPPGPASQFVPRISLLSSSAAARGGFRLSGPDGLCGSGGVRVLGALWGGAVCVCVCVCLPTAWNPHNSNKNCHGAQVETRADTLRNPIGIKGPFRAVGRVPTSSADYPSDEADAYTYIYIYMYI